MTIFNCRAGNKHRIISAENEFQAAERFESQYGELPDEVIELKPPVMEDA